MGLFGSTKVIIPPNPTLSMGDVSQAGEAARALTAQTPEERALLAQLAAGLEGVDLGVLDEMAALRARGESLADVDEAYMRRAYQPAYERLMNDYQLMDRQLMEDLNARGIAAIPGGMSEQEAYQRMLLARDTKEALARNILEAQNQAVQQKLAQYNARLAEMNQANVRRGQVFDPYYEATVVPEAERMQTRVGAASNIYNARLGHQAQMHQINTQRKMAGQQNIMNAIGAGTGLLGSLAIAGAIASDQNVKKDFSPPNTPEQDLEELTSIPVARWRYQFESEAEPMHTGGMAQDMPPDISPDGRSVDVVSYLGKTTQAIKALAKKVNGFEQLLMGGL
jgi:hypothetical protein